MPTIEELQQENEQLRRDNELLRATNRDMTMRMVGAKMMLNQVSPICSQKLSALMEECGGCDGDLEAN